MNGEWLPLVFAGLMALAMLLYVVLDGYDLGVGMLMPLAADDEKDRMVASIGPFWDANETWLVLGIGILLVAFPKAHGIILTALYLPICFMLCGLILRGVAFDFRYKAKDSHKQLWDWTFFAGSSIASLSQGYMLGAYITGFEASTGNTLFAVLTAICTAAGYALLGSTWVILKTQHNTQQKATRWAMVSLIVTLLGVAAVSIATPLVSERIFERWFSVPAVFFLSPVPLLTAIAAGACFVSLRRQRRSWLPFLSSVSLFVLSFIGLSYSLFPYLVRDRIDIWEAASAPESLMFVFYGVVVTVPAILAYTVYSYWIFWGKTSDLSYD